MMLSASAEQIDEATVTNWPESVTNRQHTHPQISLITQIFEKKTEGKAGEATIAACTNFF